MRISKTSAPRSTVVHLVNGGPVINYFHETACGRRIGDDWAGEYSEEPSGDVTCKRCMPHFEALVTAENERVQELAQFSMGERVGMVTGVLSVSGPWIFAYGTVTRLTLVWGDTVEYGVTDDKGEELFWFGYLLRHVQPCVCTDVDGFGHTCGQYPNGSPVGDVQRFAGMTLDEIDEDAKISTGGMPTDEELSSLIDGNPWGIFSGTDFVTGEPVSVPVLSTTAHEERARSMAAHPAGKGRPVKLANNYANRPGVGSWGLVASTYPSGTVVGGVKVLAYGYANRSFVLS